MKSLNCDAARHRQLVSCNRLKSYGLLMALLGITGVVVLPLMAGVESTVTVDGGGRRVLSAGYTLDGSVGGVGGVVSNVAGVNLRQGYAGQLAEVTRLVVQATPSVTNEESTFRLSGVGVLDQGSVSVLSGSNVVWMSPLYPVLAIAPDGQATSAAVWVSTTCVVTGRYLGVAGTGTVLLVDNQPDNFYGYKGDGVPDGWQVGWFGIGNEQGVGTNNPDGDAFNNEQEYVADTDPTNRASFFRILSIVATPAARVLAGSSTNRYYTLHWREDLQTGTWASVEGQAGVQGAGAGTWLQDTNGAFGRYYRVSVDLTP